MVFLFYIVFPIYILCSAAYLWFKRKRYGLGYAFLMTFSSGGIFVWSIFQSGGSTAAIGLLFVPCFACLCGFLVWAYLNLKIKSHIGFQILGVVLLISSFALCLYAINAGLGERQKAKKKNEIAQKTQEHRSWILKNANDHVGSESEWLKKEVQSKIADESFVRAALTTNFIDRETLEFLASSSSDVHVLALIIVHQKADSRLLQKIFEAHNNESRLDYAFATNHNTPNEILGLVFKRSSYTGHILATNTNTSKEILLEISKSNDLGTLEGIVKHSKADCEVLREIDKSLVKPQIPDFEKKREEIRQDVGARIKDLCPVQ